jgi:hypothetical protein
MDFKPHEFLANLLASYNYEKKKNIILEPMCSIMRMILLNYKIDGIKISIYNNSISYNEPSYYQGIIRNYNGDTREDLHNLYNPFIKSFEWYPKEDEKHELFYKLCSSGLSKLINSYDKDSIICHTLQLYTKMFDDILNDREIQKLNESKESPLLDEFRTFWKTEELEIIFKTLLFIDKCEKKDEKDNYIKIIEDIVKTKEKLVQDYIDKYSTSYN